MATTAFAVALAALVVLGGAPAALAHDDPAVQVEAVHPLGDGSFHFIVEMAYRDDGHPISGKVVTLTPTSPSGATGDPVTLEPAGDGVYQGPVALPEDGTWQVKVASADPAVSTDYGYQVSGDTGTPAEEPSSTTVAPGTTATTVAPSTTGAPSTTETTATTPEVEAETAATRADSDDGDSSALPIVLLVVAALVVALAGVPLALRTIRNATDNSPSGRDNSATDRDDPDPPPAGRPPISD